MTRWVQFRKHRTAHSKFDPEARGWLGNTRPQRKYRLSLVEVCTEAGGRTYEKGCADLIRKPGFEGEESGLTISEGDREAEWCDLEGFVVTRDME